MSADAARALMTIGDVLGLLRADFPDVTISKIRFLEAEGLIEPRRSPSGYRKFGHGDVERLRFILTAQRDHYLPLRVIKEYLQARDRGEQAPPPWTVGRGGAPGSSAGRNGTGGAALPGPAGAGLTGAGLTGPGGAGLTGAGLTGPGGAGSRAGAAGAERRPRTLVAADGVAPAQDVRLTRRQLIDGSGIDEELLTQLEAYGIVRRTGRHFDGEALSIARTAAALGAFGVQARHLRAVKAAAEREVGLIEQVVAPLLRRRSAGAHEEAAETARQIAALSLQLHAALVATGIRESLDP